MLERRRILHTILLFACALLTTPIALADEPILQRVSQLQEIAWKANRGHLGCGTGRLKVITSRTELVVSCGLDPIHVFGRTAKTADMIALLKSRAESNRTGKQGPMSGKVDDLCCVCLYTLALSKDSDALPVIVELLADKEDAIRGFAAIALYDLGASDEGLRKDIQKAVFPKAAIASAAARGKQPPTWVQKRD